MRDVFERPRPDRSRFDECLDGFRLEVVKDALVAGTQRVSHQVGSIRPNPIMPSSMWLSLC